MSGQPPPYGPPPPFGQPHQYGQTPAYGQQPNRQPPSDEYYLHHMGLEYGPYRYVDLQTMAMNRQLRSDQPLRRVDTAFFPAWQVPGLFSDKEWLVALLLSVFLGHFGVDRFYVGDIGLGVLKLLTCGGFFVWFVIDIVLIATRHMTDSDGRQLR
jgi:hypothetical protein